jgi:hypothetical protein
VSAERPEHGFNKPRSGLSHQQQQQHHFKRLHSHSCSDGEDGAGDSPNRRASSSEIAAESSKDAQPEQASTTRNGQSPARCSSSSDGSIATGERGKGGGIDPELADAIEREVAQQLPIALLFR